MAELERTVLITQNETIIRIDIEGLITASVVLAIGLAIAFNPAVFTAILGVYV